MNTRLSHAIPALLLTAACAASQAQSSVTIYGLASVEVLHVTGVNSGTVAKPVIGNQNRLDNSKVTNSRIGFKGNEDLGSGLSAVFDLESAIGIDTGTQANATKFWNRGSYVGLSHAQYGSVLLGRQWDIEDDIMSRYFIGAGYAVFQYSEFLYISDLVDNAVKYISPTMGGLKVQALVAPGEGVAGRTTEIGATYKIGSFDAGATYRTSKNPAGDSDKQAALGLSYKVGDVRLHVGWASSDMKASKLPRARAYDVGLTWDVSPFAYLTLDYVPRDQIGTDNDSYFVRLQGEYRMSKRTALFANVVPMRNKGTASQRFYGAGAPGQSQNVFSIGIRNWF